MARSAVGRRRELRGPRQVIHYITDIGVGNAWVGNELRVLEREGVPFVLHSLRNPEAAGYPVFFVSEWVEELNRATRVIYPLPPLGLALSVALAPALFGRRFFGAMINALLGKRETFRGRVASIAHLFVACHWARVLRREKVTHIHAQWIQSAGTIGMYGAWLLGVTFSFTGHAADLFRNRVALEDKIRRADFIICISSFHRAFYKKYGARDEQLHIAYCGIDVQHFAPRSRERRQGEPFQIRASGRLVEKKGFTYLIDACNLLADRGVPFECLIGGSGPLEEDLRAQVERLGLGDCVRLTGAPLKQEELPQFMHGGDVYCLPCVWAKDNDVDGLPQMLMEAVACGLPVISTRLSGIPDLVIDGKTGVLVEPGNVQHLADAVESLMNDPARAARLAAAGRQWVVEKFDISKSLQPLIALFRSKLSEDTAVTGEAEPGSDLSLQTAGAEASR